MKNLLALILGIAVPLIAAAQKYPPLIEYNFESVEQKVLPGKSTDIIKGKWGCSAGLLPEDKIGNLAIAAEVATNGCYTDGRYNHSNYPVSLGRFVSSDGKVSCEAYQFRPAQIKATEFLASKHRIHLRFDQKRDYELYTFIEGNMYKAAEVPASKIVPGEYLKINELSLDISVEVVVFIKPREQRISIYSQLSEQAEGALVFDHPKVKVYKTRYNIEGEIFDTEKGFTGGPGSHSNVYGNGRQFFCFANQGDLDVIWQEKESKKINLSRLDMKSNKMALVNLPARSGVLAAATTDPDNNLYYLVVTGEAGKKQVWVYHVTRNGKVLNSNQLDATKAGLNIWNFSESESASLAYNDDKLGMIISRTMYKSRDGLNHQGAIAVTINASTLQVIDNLGQTSGHSFDNIIYPDPEGAFIGMDLGDNYPRGIHLHKIADTKRSKLVYTFKTAHGRSPKSPAGTSYPFYSEISKGKDKFYKWSNDNHTYSELGDMVDLGDSYGVYFVGEPDPSGKAINNARARGYLFDSRNIGYVEVARDFTKYGEEVILSKGITEKGGFYTFGGRWSEQENKGIRWLTKYNDAETSNVSRLKAVAINGETYLFWEKWTPSKYVSTYMMAVDRNGKPINEPIDIGNHLRLNRRDEPFVMDNVIVFVSGNKNDSKLQIVEVAVN